MSKKDAPTDASDWFVEAGDEEFTSAQKAGLAEWLRESPVNVREFLQTTMVRRDLGNMDIPSHQIEVWIDDARKVIREPARIAFNAGPLLRGQRNEHSLETRRVRQRRSLWLCAACLGILALAAALVLQWEEGRYHTAFGEQRIVTLADGSVMELNTDSALKVQFSAHRRVIHMIRGEAYFRVAHDTARPFFVSTAEANVKAVGTQFNVRINEGATLVSVIEGLVEVRADPPSGQYTGSAGVGIAAGEQASITRIPPAASNARLAVKKISLASPQRAVSWTRGRVEFENTSLVDVMSEFQRYRHVRVVIEDDSIQQLKLTGSFEAHDPESALAYIATLRGIAVDEVGAQYFRIFRNKTSPTPRP